MLTEVKAPDRHYNTFYFDNSLLIQFITLEFLQVDHSIVQLKQNIRDFYESSLPLDIFLSSLKENLKELIGYLPEEEHSSISHWTKGSIMKLKEYCEQFSQNSSNQNKVHIRLQQVAYQVWFGVAQVVKTLNSLHLNTYTENSDANVLLNPIKKAFEALELRFNRLKRTLPRVLSAFSDNENVILFLLRRKASLSAIYGSDFLWKRFRWSKKTKELILLVAQRYQDRGFEALLSTIHQLQERE